MPTTLIDAEDYLRRIRDTSAFSYQDVEQLWLANCTKGIPQNHGGTAILNDTGPSTGSWSRSN